ncbi:MAG: hypothetical protein ABW069_09355, partial [Duganella sp.]
TGTSQQVAVLPHSTERNRRRVRRFLRSLVALLRHLYLKKFPTCKALFGKLVRIPINCTAAIFARDAQLVALL